MDFLSGPLTCPCGEAPGLGAGGKGPTRAGGLGEPQVPGPRGLPPAPPREMAERPGRGAQAARPQPPSALRLPQLTREFFTKELTKHYQGSNDTDVFSATWNSVMIAVSHPGGRELAEPGRPLPHRPGPTAALPVHLAQTGLGIGVHTAFRAAFARRGDTR